jgi:uncharacterized membrane protein
VEELFTSAIGFTVPIVEACGALVIVLEVIRTALLYLLSFFGRKPRYVPALRIRLGQSMVMGLEFQVAADILKTALSPAWNDILLLAALIGLRTVLNYLLERELEAIRVKDEPAANDRESHP